MYRLRGKPGRSMLRLLTVAAVFLVATRANAQQECEAYVGQTVTPHTFEQALTRVPNVAARGEYETTAQYEIRRNAAMADLAPLIILKVPEDRERCIRYIADASLLGIQACAFDNADFDAWTAFYGSPHGQSLDASTDYSSNIDVVISQLATPLGTYQGQNAYGATWTVTRVSSATQAIFERHDEVFAGGLFSEAGSDHVVVFLDMPPEEARLMKPALKLAFVVSPREPFVVQTTYSGRVPVIIQNPYDFTVTSTVVIGDIQCGLVLDAGNHVLGAASTR